MAARLRTHVHVSDPRGDVHVFGPEDDVPDWAREAITNPKAWAEESAEPAPSGTSESAKPAPKRRASGGTRRTSKE